MNSISRACLGLALSLLCASWFAETAFAQARAQFAVDVIATCQKPAIKDLPVHMEGTGILSTSGAARLDVDGGPLGRTRTRGQLGQTAAAPGGSTSLNVTGKSSLRNTRLPEPPDDHRSAGIRKGLRHHRAKRLKARQT